ncbi:TPR-REGION domain-containing protein [Mycena indigotica]|uniref:ER membrane protein complex subunit 2 n=1 Tax=Mycena indigotica TaxID=2126181 RepID=A0A8H6S5Z2_9AGAR|nr:TPR-REGION domain-containing protein [Mycena indigotica]KAF7292845.1 TPR-REGION domain-containing protein [Mycena indigotica]
MMALMSLATALDQLSTFRTNNSRSSQETFKHASVIIKSSQKIGDDGWAVLEQLFLAAVDIGRLDVADECLKQLSTQFPDSPRVEVLTGIRMEATESPDVVLQYYNGLLEADSANAAVWKRKISVLRRTGKVEKAVEELSQLLDTIYTDVDGWLELADLYASCNQYTQALQALSHVLLLASQNPFYFQQYAETAYTAGDLPLALKYHLIVVDMCERDLDDIKTTPPTGLAVRAWMGVKLCARRIILHSPPSASGTAIPKSINVIEQLATERVLAAYSSSKRDKSAMNREVVVSWVGAR